MSGKHYAVLCGLVAALGMQIASLHSWSEAVTPLFFGGMLVQIGTTVGGIFISTPAETRRQDAAEVRANEAIGRRFKADAARQERR